MNGEITIPNIMLARYKGKTVSFLGTVQTVHEARPMFTVPYNHGEPIRGFADYNFTQRIAVTVE